MSSRWSTRVLSQQLRLGCNSWNPFSTLLGGRSRIMCDLHLRWQIIRWRWMVIGTSCLPNIILSAVCIWKQSLLSGPRNKLLMCWFFWKAYPQGLYLQVAEMGQAAESWALINNKVWGLSCLPASHCSWLCWIRMKNTFYQVSTSERPHSNSILMF